VPQPSLGILTLYLNDKKQLEERQIYQKMIIEGQKLGLDIFVFTPMDVHKNKDMIWALIYNPSTKKWSRKWQKFPQLIFDRCRIQKSKRFEQLKTFRARYRDKLFLNRPLRDKWTIHQTLSQKSKFRPFLPQTKLFLNINNVLEMLQEHQCVYVKPINGTGGRGILRIEKLSPNQYRIQGRKPSRQIIPERKVNLVQLKSYLLHWRGDKRFLVQQGIQIKLPNGRVHDYRMLVQKNGNGKWQVTGCAGRMGPERSVTSNLHGGGKAIPMDNLLKEWKFTEVKREQIRTTAEQLSLEIAAYLEDTYEALCELALDLGIDRQGRIYLIEVNPKPARQVFLQSGDTEAYQQAIRRPLEYALWLHKQNNTASS
jgi:glutathione synthase/RimK-type ligase-like ATP-grasp enzyme